MRKQELEYKVLQIIDRVKSSQRVEDSTVELKAAWIDDRKAARHIAAHANASRGEPITWIIGLDEKAGVVGADEVELANWWPKVNRHFEEKVFPDLVFHLSIADAGKSVVVLHFETDRAPYVVGTGSTPVNYEVPWREGNSVRTAKRSDLLRLLVPLVRLPLVEVLDAEASRSVHSDAVKWSLIATIYVVPSSTTVLNIPTHKCSMTLSIIPPAASQPKLKLVAAHDSAHISVEHAQVCLTGAGFVRAMAHETYGNHPGYSDDPPELDIVLKLAFAGAEGTISLVLPCKVTGKNNTGEYVWKWIGSLDLP